MSAQPWSVVDNDRDEARSARLAAWQAAEDAHAYGCMCRACVIRDYDAAEERP